MIARIWHGKTPVNKAADYLNFLRKTGIPDYKSTTGNLGVYILRQVDRDQAHFLTLTFWESIDAIKLFAGEEFERARYYPEDKDFLLEFEPNVQHYELFTEEQLAMTEKAQILDELHKIYDGDAWHADNLVAILANITVEQALAKPIAEAHSIWELVLHLAAWNETWVARLQGESRSEPIDGDFPRIADTSEQTWQEALLRLETSIKNLIAAIGGIDDDSFAKRVADRDYTLSSFLHGIVRHIVYHSGQIALLKKASAPLARGTSSTPKG